VCVCVCVCTLSPGFFCKFQPVKRQREWGWCERKLSFLTFLFSFLLFSLGSPLFVCFLVVTRQKMAFICLSFRGEPTRPFLGRQRICWSKPANTRTTKKQKDFGAPSCEQSELDCESCSYHHRLTLVRVFVPCLLSSLRRAPSISFSTKTRNTEGWCCSFSLDVSHIHHTTHTTHNTIDHHGRWRCEWSS
jgi:hypothetical protein